MSILDAVLALFPADRHQWTADDVDRAAEIVCAIEAGHLTLTADGTLAADPAPLERHGPKRQQTAVAKQVAAAIGRPKPTKHADILTDVVVYAACLAA